MTSCSGGHRLEALRASGRQIQVASGSSWVLCRAAGRAQSLAGFTTPLLASSQSTLRQEKGASCSVPSH